MDAPKRLEPIEFLKSKNNLFRNWQECRGHVCEIEDLRVSMNKAPPPLASPLPQATESTKEGSARKSQSELFRADILNVLSKVVETKRAFFDWVESPPSPPKPAAPPPSPASRVPPFDIQDVPKAMDKL